MGVDLIHLWGTMGWFAKGIVYVLAIMSLYSLGGTSVAPRRRR